MVNLTAIVLAKFINSTITFQMPTNRATHRSRGLHYHLNCPFVTLPQVDNYPIKSIDLGNRPASNGSLPKWFNLDIVYEYL